MREHGNSQAALIFPATPPTRDELLARAEALVPMLQERAAQCESARALPAETVHAFEEAGFYRILQPRAYGGYEMCPTVMYDVAMILARGCPSSAWCMSLVSIHNWEMALFDPRAAEDVWGESPNARISSSYAPFGEVTRTDGGYTVSGRWTWSSGCDHCQWVFLGGRITGEDGAPAEMCVFLLPREDYEIEDTWFVSGLQGTGSNDVVVDGAFVPEHRAQSFVDSYLGHDPGLKTFTAPTYKHPFGVALAFSLSCVTLGIAKGALETYREQMQTKTGAYDGARAFDDPFVRQRFAEADAQIRGADQRMREVFRRYEREYIKPGLPIPRDARVSGKWDAQHVARASAEAVALLFRASGGNAIRLDNPMQRYFRDVHAACNHAFLNSDKGGGNAGGVLLGGANTDLVI